MTPASNGQAVIIRTERGLTIAGTRITLYDLMDFITAGYPHSFIRYQFSVTDEQFNAAMSYIEANRAEVETEYQTVLKKVEENQKYWEERNRERFARIAKMPPPPGMEVAWEKLQKAKARLDSKA
ncbi:DUF433 domain-containing protein [Brasilonema bromeliae]|uniref:DUF433 domain-containing protein n=1 Tax=Brasilonema bromeliae SPC951 TaxID=385972 RepID=A0ABX1PDZ7_9CYAN|nr:DUF433 domain-containing protein [Brasilonema bromeliae]NMG21811.1 DUF433 domain-containing protein [Brasilonema bromeliae SPC951]